MITVLLAMFAGMAVGTALAGPLGGVLGTILGLGFAMLWCGVRDVVASAGPGAELVREDLRVLCVPTGQVATTTYVRDAATGRWLDVARCSLCKPADQVGCGKNCLLLVRDSLPPRRHPAVSPQAPSG